MGDVEVRMCCDLEDKTLGGESQGSAVLGGIYVHVHVLSHTLGSSRLASFSPAWSWWSVKVHAYLGSRFGRDRRPQWGRELDDDVMTS
jgi:hypothetical protein